MASLVAQTAKNLHPGTIPESERTLEKETATHSSTLAWEIPWTEEPGGLQSIPTLDILEPTSLIMGGVLCLVGYLPASLVSTC